jgi:hypothetical protein
LPIALTKRSLISSFWPTKGNFLTFSKTSAIIARGDALGAIYASLLVARCYEKLSVLRECSFKTLILNCFIIFCRAVDQ